MKHSCVQVAHLNVRSLVPKLPELRNFIKSKDFDIFTVSETWLNNLIDNDSLKIEGYNVFRVDRLSRGGGVAIYYKELLRCKIIDTSNNIEQLWISVSSGDISFVVGVCYRPPQTNFKYFVDELEESISICMQHEQQIYCLGDFNIDLLKVDSPEARYFLSMIESVNMHQVINEATHIGANSAASLIDVILCTNPALVVSTGVGGIDLSDHELIYCSISCQKPKIEPFYYTYRDFKNFNEQLFYQDLQLLPLHSIYLVNDVDLKVDILNQYLLTLFDRHIPLKTVRITKSKAPWLTDNVRLLMSQRDKAKAKYRKTGNNVHWEYYKQLRNFTNHAISNEKKAYFNHVSKNKNSKILWKELKSLNINNSQRSNIPPNLQDPNNINNYFIDSIPNNLNNNVDDVVNYYELNRICNSEFCFTLVTEETIFNVLSKLKNTSPGPDNISIGLIKLCCPYILKFLVNIINSIILDCKFPSCWKNAFVTPIPKTRDPQNLSDLRPISILPGLSKLTEKIFEIQLREYLDTNNILPNIQSGFRKGYSCCTALLGITDDIFQAVDGGKCTALVLLDFSKAFDTINHSILLALMKSCGINDEGTKLFQSYLQGRIQRIRLRGNISDARYITRGVPQGSILGPLLFTIYTSQFPKYIEHSTIHMYADDTQVIHSFSFPEYAVANAKINSDLKELSRISLEHSLILNPAKSAVLLFGKKSDCISLQQNMNIGINNVRIDISNSSKNLGILLDRSLRFREQTAKNIQKAYTALRLLYPHKSYLSRDTKKMLCETLVLSQFIYCAPVYGPCLDTDCINRIQRVQNSCIRFIYGIRKFDHVSHKLKELKWLNMEDRCKLYALCLFHKIILSRTPPYLYNKISFRSDIHNINIRYKSQLTPPIHKTALFERSFKYSSYKLYNSIPERFKAYNIVKFKMSVKKYFLEKAGVQ